MNGNRKLTDLIFSAKTRQLIIFVLILITHPCDGLKTVEFETNWPIDRKVLPDLVEAKRLFSTGNASAGKLLLNKIRKISPKIPNVEAIGRPSTIEKPTSNIPINNVSPMSSQKEILEALLLENPADVEIRKLLLEIAEQTGNWREYERHKSVLNAFNKGGEIADNQKCNPYLLITCAFVLIFIITVLIKKIFSTIQQDKVINEMTAKVKELSIEVKQLSIALKNEKETNKQLQNQLEQQKKEIEEILTKLKEKEILCETYENTIKGFQELLDKETTK